MARSPFPHTYIYPRTSKPHRWFNLHQPNPLSPTQIPRNLLQPASLGLIITPTGLVRTRLQVIQSIVRGGMMISEVYRFERLFFGANYPFYYLHHPRFTAPSHSISYSATHSALYFSFIIWIAFHQHSVTIKPNR